MTVEEFMSGSYEEKINKKMMYYDYSFPSGEVIEYINRINELEIPVLVKYILENPAPAISAQDVFQFSSFDDATLRLCQRMKEVDNPGLSHLEVGKLLLNDGKERKDGAYTKYGENHAKTGAAIGLIQELTKTYFLSCVGYVYPELSVTEKDALMTRLLLRNSFIKRVINATQNGNVFMRQFLYMLSDSTYVRRSSNIRKIMNVLADTEEYDFSVITNNMIYLWEK